MSESAFLWSSYAGFAPFFCSLWADFLFEQNPHGIARGTLLWWSFVVGLLWPIALALGAFGAAFFGVIITCEKISASTFGQWMREEIKQ